MSERVHQFSVGEAPRCEVATVWGDIMVVGGEPGTVEVRIDGPGAERFRVEDVGGTVVVEPERGRLLRRFVSADIVLKVPEGSELDLKAGSGDISIDVPVRSLSVSLTSGDLRAKDVAEFAKVKAASGDLKIEHIGDWGQLASASGDVRIGRIDGDLTVSSASGDVRIDRACGALTVKLASGDLDVRHFAGDQLEAKSMSGDVRIGIPPGRTLAVDLETVSGDVRNELPVSSGPATGGAGLRVKSLAGDVILTKAS